MRFLAEVHAFSHTLRSPRKKGNAIVEFGSSTSRDTVVTRCSSGLASGREEERCSLPAIVLGLSLELLRSCTTFIATR